MVGMVTDIHHRCRASTVVVEFFLFFFYLFALNLFFSSKWIVSVSVGFIIVCCVFSTSNSYLHILSGLSKPASFFIPSVWTNSVDSFISFAQKYKINTLENRRNSGTSSRHAWTITFITGSHRDPIFILASLSFVRLLSLWRSGVQAVGDQIQPFQGNLSLFPLFFPPVVWPLSLCVIYSILSPPAVEWPDCSASASVPYLQTPACDLKRGFCRGFAGLHANHV